MEMPEVWDIYLRQSELYPVWNSPKWEGEAAVTQKQLTRLGLEWQRRLRLQDWEVEYSFNPHAELEADARTEFNPQLKCARVKICTPGTRVGACGNLQAYDAEQFLIHELLHLHWHFIHADSPMLESLETAIDCTAWALVQAKRGARV